MAFEISEIKRLRKKLGLTQSELASKSGVSQSLIAKIEAGVLDPAYSKTQKIFSALESLSKQKGQKASEIMQSKIVNIEPEAKIKDAIAKMKKHDISQLPVVKDDNVIGMVSESIKLDSLINKRCSTVSEIMHDAPPIVAETTPIDVVSNLLKFYPMLVVSEKGKVKGVITKSDVINKLRV
jgi:predicted transcriptional regulator